MSDLDSTDDASARLEHSVTTLSIDNSNGEGSALLDDLMQRCRSLLCELNAFKAFLEKAKEDTPKSKFESAVDTKQFQGMIATEMKSLEKVRHIIHLYSRSMMMLLILTFGEQFLHTYMCLFKRLFLKPMFSTS